MAKRRVQHRRPENQARRRAPAQDSPQPDEERRKPPAFSLRPEPLTEERRKVLEQIPAWARALRIRSGLVIASVAIGAIAAYNVGGKTVGPAAAGVLMVGVGLALWRADKLERRARERMEGEASSLEE